MNPKALLVLQRRRDRLLAAGKGLLLLAVAALLAGMTFYTYELDSPTMRTVLLPSSLNRALLLSRLDPLPIERIWGGPATRYGATACATAFVVMSFVALVEARLGGRKISLIGLILPIPAVILFVLLPPAAGLDQRVTYLRPAQTAALVELVGRRQPEVLEAVRFGRAPDLPGRAEIITRLATDRDGAIFIPSAEHVQPIMSGEEVEALRFVLAQQAAIAGDRTALRALLPVRLPSREADSAGRNDIGQRLAAIGRAAGMPAVAPRERPGVASEQAAWKRGLLLLLLLRHLFQLLLAAGLVSLAAGVVIRRRLVRMDRGSARIAGVTAT